MAVLTVNSGYIFQLSNTVHTVPATPILNILLGKVRCPSVGNLWIGIWYLGIGNLRYKPIKQRIWRWGSKEGREFQNLENAIQDFLTYPGGIILCQKSGPFPQTNSIARIRGTNESTGFAVQICFTASLAKMHPFRKAQQIHMELKDS